MFFANTIGPVVMTLLDNEAHQATKYLGPKMVVKATRRLVCGKIDKRSKNLDIVLTIGSPNYADRLYIKDLVKAGEPFPVKKIRLKFPAKKRKAK